MYVLVTRNQCNFCDLAKEILKGSGIMYVEYNVQSGSSRWILDLLKKAGYTTVPQVWDSQGNHIGGYTELKEALVREL
jgi:glutaredoxin